MKILIKEYKTKIFTPKRVNTLQGKNTFKKRQALQELCQEITHDNLNIFIEWDKSSMGKEFNF